MHPRFSSAFLWIGGFERIGIREQGMGLKTVDQSTNNMEEEALIPDP